MMWPIYGVIGNCCGVEYMECGVMWYVSNVKWGPMRDVSGVMHNVADVVRFDGIAKWNSVLRLEVLV